MKVLNSLSILKAALERKLEERSFSKPRKFSKDKEQSTPQPAMSIDSRKIFKFLLNFSNFYKNILKIFQKIFKTFKIFLTTCKILN